MKELNNINEKLRYLRESNGLKSKFVAKKIGVSPGTYSEFETGKRNPRIEHLIVLRDLYNISLDDLFFNDMIAKRDLKQKECIS
ncbi:helix-turn-helix domain-containing protein [Paraliobacillus ryukyuensis]|uniref:helix-turn-helix domain-containing protein n=1 Tax=Paraliobacillus ryukyuensis TaxID=200904 RepID=UPI0009A7AD03|nr:helix-turn-helix transcriptional regulator [Paraliobacillus ryukyuensis]